MSKVFDEYNKEWVEFTGNNLLRGIVYVDDNYCELGYFDRNAPFKHDVVYKGDTFDVLLSNNTSNKIYYDRMYGHYHLLIKPVNKRYLYASGSFPYSFDRFYSTRYLEEYFKKFIVNQNLIQFKYIDELPYTFGLEFETAAGYIPEDLVKKSGLIPLRDGSINGLEYSTIVLKGNEGFNLIKSQIDILKEYTIFDKDCSLHIHFGNFKLNEDVLLKVNNLFATCDIYKYVPRYAFDTTKFKKNTLKNYCSRNTEYFSFNQMYQNLVGRNYYGDLYQPHPNDSKGASKWNIKTRYKAVNFINAICYNFGKTIEFRFLHPTYNFDRIICWIFILGALIKYAENNNKLNHTVLIDIIKSVYSNELADILVNALMLQEDTICAQSIVNDNYGYRNDIEDIIMSYKNLSKNQQNFFY